METPLQGELVPTRTSHHLTEKGAVSCLHRVSPIQELQTARKTRTSLQSRIIEHRPAPDRG